MSDKKDTPKLDTVAGAYEALTGRELETNNNSNALGQLDRAYRQSSDRDLKNKIAKALGFDVAVHDQGPRKVSKVKR